MTVQGEVQAPKPPLPKAAYRIINPIMKTLLRSPLHGLLSHSLMVLAFQGRKSGKRYTIPVGYHERGDTLYLFTHSAWWKNLRGGAPVMVRLRGQEVPGTAELVQDIELMMEIVRGMIAKQGEATAKRLGFLDAKGQPTVAPGTVFIRIQLERRSA